MLAQTDYSQLGCHIRALDDRLFAFLERCCCRLFLLVASLTAHIKDYLLCSKLLQGALHLLNIRPTVVLLLARRLCPQFVLLDGAQAVKPVLQIWYPLAVQKRLGCGLIIPRIMHLVYYVD